MIAMKTMFKAKGLRTGYATTADFAEIFSAEMHSLFYLALLLTADVEKAERCFVCGIEECVEGINSFRGWARTWARRSIVKHAIRIVAPALKTVEIPGATCLPWLAGEKTINLFRPLPSLNAFERFAFVLSFLEKHASQESSLMLGCSRRDFDTARIAAIRKLCSRDFTWTEAIVEPFDMQDSNTNFSFQKRRPRFEPGRDSPPHQCVSVVFN